MYTNEMKSRLINLLQIYLGKTSIIESKDHGNFQNDYKIVKRDLIGYFSDNKITSYNWKNDSHIYLEEFIDFLTSGELNSKTDTKGLYHKYMDCLLVLYNVEIVKGNNFPNFEKLSKKERDLVEPKRFEYKVIWWLVHKIRTHPFLHKHEQLLGITYQKPIRAGDRKFYDLLFININVIIEVQEKGRAHDENENDLTKEGMVALRGKRIVYLKMDGFDDREGYKSYLDTVWYGIKYDRKPNNLISEPIEIIGLEKILINGLVSYDYENKIGILSDYILYEFEIKRKNYINNLIKNLEEYKKLSKNIRKLYKNKYNHDIQKLEELQSGSANNKNYIDILFNWYKKSYMNCDEFIIEPDSEDFQKIFNNISDKEKYDEFIELSYISGFCGNKGYTSSNLSYSEFDKNKVGFSWNGLCNIFLNPLDELNKTIILNLISSEDKIISYSKWILELLQTVEKSHKDIIRFISEHHNACYKNITTLWNKNEKYIKDEINMANSKKISELENTIMDLKETSVYNDERINCILKKTSVLFDRVEKYQELRQLTKNLHEILDEIKKASDEIKSYRKLKMTNCTVQFVEYESVIKELPNFPIKYTGLELNRINVMTFEKECIDWGVPNDKIKYIKEALNCSGKASVIYKLVNNNIDNITQTIKSSKKTTLDNLYYKDKDDSDDSEDESEDDSESEKDIDSVNESDNDEDEITEDFDPLSKKNIYLLKNKK